MFWRIPIGGSIEPWPPLSKENQARYPALAERFAIADRTILPKFIELDKEAGEAQRTDRRLQFFLIMGAAATSIIGAIQAAGGDPRWLGAVLAMLAYGTRRLSTIRNKSDTLGQYLTARAKTEELRSLYFRFLSGAEGNNERELETKVLDITHSDDAGA